MPTKDRQYLEIRQIAVWRNFYSISDITNSKILQVSKINTEYSVFLASLGKDRIEEIGNIMSKHSAKVNIPPDLKLFYQASELEKLLNGVREKILALIDAVTDN